MYDREGKGEKEKRKSNNIQRMVSPSPSQIYIVSKNVKKIIHKYSGIGEPLDSVESNHLLIRLDMSTRRRSLLSRSIGSILDHLAHTR